MIAFILFGLIAGACAAPQFNFGPPRRPYFSNYHLRSHPYVDENIFDTERYWADLTKELKELDDILAEFTRRISTSVSQEVVEGNEYKITISLPEFDEKDIIVKAREGLLMIQATHKYSEASQRNYLDVRTLPNTVNVAGNWIFEKGVLKITFPLKEGATTPEVTQTSTEKWDFETALTARPKFAGSREEIETNTNEGVHDADIGLVRGNLDKETELKTNEIPSRNTVEATTYAVDLKDEVEFVPVRY